MSATPAVQAWAGCAAWSVLDCAFGNGQHFLDIWSAWRADSQRPPMLHFVAIADTFTGSDSTDPCAAALNAACIGLPSGFHRIALEDGQLSLTLCLGKASDMLNAQDFQADQIFAPASALATDKWAIKALARCCKRGTQLAMHDAAPDDLPTLWADAGFKPLQAPTPCPGLNSVAVYDPAWTLKRTRHGGSAWVTPAGRCAVVGAGLAGASVARALALRGWQVTVLDQAAQPASGASGLPVGLVVPHVSADDSPRSRLSRAGARMMLAHAHNHMHAGEDWAPSGVTEMRLNPATLQREPHWHAMAGWLKPAALVRAWLKTPGVAFQGHTPITRLAHDGSRWNLIDDAGRTVAQADVVVLANAMGCRALLQGMPLPEELTAKLQALHAMYGTMTLGTALKISDSNHPFPATPVNGMGSFVPHVPATEGAFWAAGATFETDAAALVDQAAQHRANQQRLQSLLPDVAKALEPQFQNSQVTAWSGERCVTHDRLPWVGPVELSQPGVWVCAGMGSRGLSFSALCAEFLAARLGEEPLPLEANLLRSLDINRPLSRKGHAQPAIPFVASRRSGGD